MERPGMSYSEARRRISDLKVNKGVHPVHKMNLSRSLVNQVRVREGNAAAMNLVREVSGG